MWKGCGDKNGLIQTSRKLMMAIPKALTYLLWTYKKQTRKIWNKNIICTWLTSSCVETWVSDSSSCNENPNMYFTVSKKRWTGPIKSLSPFISHILHLLGAGHKWRGQISSVWETGRISQISSPFYLADFNFVELFSMIHESNSGSRSDCPGGWATWTVLVSRQAYLCKSSCFPSFPSSHDALLL